MYPLTKDNLYNTEATTMQQQITIRNSAEPIPGQRYRWRVHVEIQTSSSAIQHHHDPQDYPISSVSVELHPTFQPATRVLRKVTPTHFQSQYFTGWGTFEIPVTLTKKNGQQIELTHCLDFAEGGGSTQFISKDTEESQKHQQGALTREEHLEQLARVKFLEHDSPIFWHGRLNGNEITNKEPSSFMAQRPQMTWQSSKPPRHDHTAPSWLTASEYQDTDTMLSEKIRQLANLMRVSQKTVIYSGAGISVAAGIGQASRGSAQGRNLSTTAQPTLTHYALADLSKNGLIHGWVQQNHDGLPQKAGFPQEDINEIHGSWYDPSNPVVKYSGSLRQYEFEWMEREAETADLVLVLGTSLSGLNADQVATEPAYRSLQKKSLGMVIISPQQTPHDGKATLRIFGSSDDVLRALLEKLNMPMPEQSRQTAISLREQPRRILVPYDANGKRLPTTNDEQSQHHQGTGGPCSRMMWLDLRPGASIRIVGHNIEGAQQPSQQVIVHKKNADGQVIRWDPTTQSIQLRVHRASFQLGFWWLDAAQQGRVPTIPIVNCDPEYE